MIAAPATQDWTAGVLLYGDNVLAGLAARIADPETEAALRHRVGAVGAMALRTVEQDLAPVAARFLDLDLVSVLLTGWNKHRELQAAAARTQSSPPWPSEERVTLAAHDIALAQHPSVDVLVNGQTVLTIRFELVVTISVDAMDAFIRRGWLVGLGAGRCIFKIAFSAQGTELGTREIAVDPRLVVPLGQGIPLGVPLPRGSGSRA